MAVGDLITATNFNNLQTRVAQILGNGSGSEGYGETVASVPVAPGDLVTANDLNAIFTDFDKIYRHQANAAPTNVVIPSVDDIIGWDASDNPDAVLKGFQDFLDFQTLIETDPQRFALAASQSSDNTSVVSPQETDSFNTNTHCRVRCTFTSADTRRHFFNSGGKITFQTGLVSSASGGNINKTNDWATMLSNAGTVSFNYNSTTTNNSGTGSAIGNYQLTSSEQQLFRKTGSGVYADNNYYIRAKEVSSAVIEFRIWLNDADTGSTSTAKGVVPIDEFVQGTITTNCGFVRASGSYVDVAAPTFSIFQAYTIFS